MRDITTTEQKLRRRSESSGAFVWCLALPKDFISGSISCGVTLVHDGVLAVGSPHSSASQPPLFKEDFTESNCPPDSLTPGEGFHKWYHTAKLYRVNRAFPKGEGGPAKPGRMRATSRKHSVVYQRNTVPSGTTDKILLRSKTPCMTKDRALMRSAFCFFVYLGRERKERGNVLFVLLCFP